MIVFIHRKCGVFCHFRSVFKLCNGMRLLQYDYLGGHGTRGYGKIKFSGLNIKSVLGDVHDNILNECKAYLKDVEE